FVHRTRECITCLGGILCGSISAREKVAGSCEGRHCRRVVGALESLNKEALDSPSTYCRGILEAWVGDAYQGIAVNSATLGRSAIAIAAARAGGIGILDIDAGSDPVSARAMVAQLLAATDGEIGLRLGADYIPHLSDQIGLFVDRRHCLLLHGDAAAINAAAA